MTIKDVLESARIDFEEFLEDTQGVYTTREFDRFLTEAVDIPMWNNRELREMAESDFDLLINYSHLTNTFDIIDNNVRERIVGYLCELDQEYKKCN